jgi:Spy/CpxP family protein refolding chaperone
MQTRLFRLTLLTTLLATLLAVGGLANASSATDAITGATQTAPTQSSPFSMATVFAPDTGSLRLADELELTLEQRDLIKLALYELEPRWRQLAENGKALGETFSATSPEAADYATVTAQVSQLAANQAAELVMLVAETRARMANILTDEQEAELKTRLKEKHSRHDAPDADPAPEAGGN